MMGSTEPERRWAIEQGAKREWLDWEKPQHRVTIREPFATGRFPVTRGEFAAFVEATGHDMSGGCWVWSGKEWKLDPTADWCAPGFAQTDRHPVVGVGWHDAQAYLEWLGRETGQPYRLLSEAEWEFACRAGTASRYSWGDAAPTREQANFGRNLGGTSEVGAYPPNAWGLYEMHGNVLEWVEDCWNDGYSGRAEGRQCLDRGRLQPPGAARGLLGLRSSEPPFRHPQQVLPRLRGNRVGFRVARTLTP